MSQLPEIDLVVLAAGQGRRLGALALGRTKAMMPVAGLPLFCRVLDGLFQGLSGVLALRSVIIAAHPEDHELAAYCTGMQLPAPLHLVLQNERRGMAHALLQVAPYLDGDFLLSACDNLLPPDDLQRMALTWVHDTQATGMLSLLRAGPEAGERSAVVEVLGGDVRRIVEKPGLARDPVLVSLPLYFFRPSLLEHLDRVLPSLRGEMELQDAIQTLIAKQGQVRGQVVSGRKTVTDAADLLRLNLELLEQEAAGKTPSPGEYPGVSFLPPVRVEAGAQIAPGCRIGPGVYIESGARVEAGARLERALVLRGAVVAAGASIVDAIAG